MLKQFAGTITSFLVRDNIITEEEKEVYQYGTEQLIINFTTLLVISVIAFSLKFWTPTLFWFVGILPIRTIAGGFHANSPIKCNLLTLLIYIANIALISLFSRHMTINMLVILLCLIVFSIFKFAPVDHKNKVLENSEYLIAKKKSRTTGIVIFVVCLSAYRISGIGNELIVSTVMGALTASISLIIGSIKRGGEKNEKIDFFA